MTTNFKCPKCRKTFKLGRLHAKCTCPNCHTTMIISRDEKMAGRKLPRSKITNY